MRTTYHPLPCVNLQSFEVGLPGKDRRTELQAKVMMADDVPIEGHVGSIILGHSRCNRQVERSLGAYVLWELAYMVRFCKIRKRVLVG